MKGYSGGGSRLPRGLMIFYGVSVGVALLEILLAFIQTTHILGFILALILLGLSCFMFWFVWSSARKDTFEQKRTMFVIISIAMFAFTLFIGILAFIKLLTFMFSPNLKKSLSNSNDFDNIATLHNNQTISGVSVDNEGTIFVQLSDDNPWDKFTNCVAKGAQRRLQNNELSVLPPYAFVHVNESEPWIGLVTDIGIYAGGTGGASIRCQKRIGHNFIAKQTDITNDWIISVLKCVKVTKKEMTLESE